jgi:hypothetical protein
VTYNKNSVAFCNAYPQTDFPVFFEARVPALAEQSLLAALGPLVSGRSEVEAVNLLLRFVQTAFDYQTDDDQFGREKYMFVEETLSYPHSDCEDRAILFSFLVRRLTGLEVVGLHYPGHLATAVLFNNAVRGLHQRQRRDGDAAIQIGDTRSDPCPGAHRRPKNRKIAHPSPSPLAYTRP